MNRLTRLVLCTLLPPLMLKIADILDDEVKETKTRWDDLAIIALRQFASFLPTLCKELEES